MAWADEMQRVVADCVAAFAEPVTIGFVDGGTSTIDPVTLRQSSSPGSVTGVGHVASRTTDKAGDRAQSYIETVVVELVATQWPREPMDGDSLTLGKVFSDQAASVVYQVERTDVQCSGRKYVVTASVERSNDAP